MCRLFEGFLRSRMTTARIGPETPRMIFCLCSFLEKQLTVRAKNKYRECPVQCPFAMRYEFFRNANFLVIGIHQNHFFFHRLLSPAYGERRVKRLESRD